MNPQRYRRIMSVVDAVLDATEAERLGVLESLCSDDAKLRIEVEELLAQNTAADGFLEASPSVETQPPSLVGSELGNYRIIEEIGRGGMGAVYLAERADKQYHTRVAIKLIKRGMDTDYILHRFRNERQILANLNHPNIARLLDGGMTPDGLPYLVMEYIDGSPIDRYADEHGLTTTQRLELFTQICSAVDFAHHLIIHRDIKPSNILVTKDGVPKLLDFGIAKILCSEDEVDETGTMFRVMTPEYASPEQLKGERVTAATDIYSLGILLYELLTGKRPYRLQSRQPSEIIRAVCESEPVRPSIAVSQAAGADTRWHVPREVARDLRGDLDNIILMALRKEPERRYPSAAAFADDIRRYVEGRPVIAHKDSGAYRASKFVRRHAIGAAAAAAVLLALTTGLVLTTWQASVARAERSRAERRFNDVRQLANSFVFEINDSIRKNPTQARELLVTRAIEYLDRLRTESGSDADLNAELAAAYERIGDVQAELFKPSSGKTSEALASHRKALELRQQVFSADASVDRATALASSYAKVAHLLITTGEVTEARNNYESSIATLNRALEKDPAHYKLRRQLGGVLAMLGQAILRSGSLLGALENYQRSLAIFDQLRDEHPDEPTDQRNVGILQSYIGFVRLEMGEPEAALACYKAWLDIEQAIADKDPANTESIGQLSNAHIWYGMSLNENGRTAEALEHLTRGVEMQQRLFEADTTNMTERTGLADAYLQLGRVLVAQNAPHRAAPHFEKALTHYEVVAKSDPENFWTKRLVSASRMWLGNAMLRKGSLDAAEAHISTGLTEIEQLIAAHPDYTEWQSDLAQAHRWLGEIHTRHGEPAKALHHFHSSIPILERLASESPENAKRRDELKQVRAFIDKLGSSLPDLQRKVLRSTT